MKTQLILILVALLFCSCAQIPPDEELTMPRTPYTGKELKINGWYKGEKVIYNNCCEYVFFYSNGVFLEFVDSQNIENVNQFTGGIDSFRARKFNWGLYQIESKLVHVQRWASNYNTGYLIVNNRTYKIINDTTLLSDSLYGDVRYYHFKHFLPKPDSTNVFTK